MLIEALDASCADRVDKAILDWRLHQVSSAFAKVAMLLVRNTIRSRLYAEWHVWRSAQKGDTVLCLHSLPPLLPLRAKVVVLVQNRLLLETGALTGFPWKTRLRIGIERLWGAYLQGHCNRYMVQTPAMARAVAQWLRTPRTVAVVPFAPDLTPDPKGSSDSVSKDYDFVYVASGETHKNHRRLLEAWRLLAEGGLKPSLALTVHTQQYPGLAHSIQTYVAQYGLRISNLGDLKATEMPLLYAKSRAMVYPSLIESFGLPLIEASQHGLPIIAGELDFVRDVVSPSETFDATSSVSIARALRRFLGQSEQPLTLCTGSRMIDEAMQ